jgi:hypothetical protein
MRKGQWMAFACVCSGATFCMNLVWPLSNSMQIYPQTFKFAISGNSCPTGLLHFLFEFIIVRLWNPNSRSYPIAGSPTIEKKKYSHFNIVTTSLCPRRKVRNVAHIHVFGFLHHTCTRRPPIISRFGYHCIVRFRADKCRRGVNLVTRPANITIDASYGTEAAPSQVRASYHSQEPHWTALDTLESGMSGPTLALNVCYMLQTTS